MNIKYTIIAITTFSLTSLLYSCEYTRLINEPTTTYRSAELQDNQILLTNNPLLEISLNERYQILLSYIDENSILKTDSNLVDRTIDSVFASLPDALYQEFIEKCAKAFRNGKIPSLFQEALHLNCLNLARIILKSKLVNVDCKNSKGFTGLMLATGKYNLDAIDFLIKENANLEITDDKTKLTALELLAGQSKWIDTKLQKRVAQLLIDAGAKTKKAKEIARTEGNPLLFNSVASICFIQ